MAHEKSPLEAGFLIQPGLLFLCDSCLLGGLGFACALLGNALGFCCSFGNWLFSRCGGWCCCRSSGLGCCWRGDHGQGHGQNSSACEDGQKFFHGWLLELGLDVMPRGLLHNAGSTPSVDPVTKAFFRLCQAAPNSSPSSFARCLAACMARMNSVLTRSCSMEVMAA